MPYATLPDYERQAEAESTLERPNGYNMLCVSRLMLAWDVSAFRAIPHGDLP